MHESDKTSSSRDHHLASCARREARRHGARFSEDLHGRIMCAVKDSGPANPEQSQLVPRPDDGTAFRTAPAFGAALVAVIALVVLSRFHFEEPVIPAATSGFASSTMPDADAWPVMQTIPGRVRNAVDTAVEQQQYAGLDRDARQMSRFLAKQVPFQSQWNKP